MLLSSFECLVGVEFQVYKLEGTGRGVASAPAVLSSRSNARTRRVRTRKARPHICLHGMPALRCIYSAPHRRFSIMSERRLRIPARILVIVRLQTDWLRVAGPYTRRRTSAGK